LKALEEDKARKLAVKGTIGVMVQAYRNDIVPLDEIGTILEAVFAVACRFLDIEEKELARRFNVDRSAISRATQRVSRDPELLSATKPIQREPELERNQH